MKILLKIIMIVCWSLKLALGAGPDQCSPMPLKACSKANPCKNSLTRSSEIPTCHEDILVTVKRRKGSRRYFCQYSPVQKKKKVKKRPLIILLHGGGGNAENLYLSTKLREKAMKKKFHLVRLQARNVHLNFGNLTDGRHFDSYFSTWSKNSPNHDVSDVDLVIKKMVDRGDVDSKKIYMIGWSEGALFSQMYGIMREHIPSRYGHRIAGVVAFTGSNPYSRAYVNNHRCESSYKFKTKLPILLISRNCDVVACEENAYNYSYVPEWVDTTSMQAWENVLKKKLKNPNVERIIIDDDGNKVSTCSAVRDCSQLRAIRNHITWPIEQETKMLKFLFKESL